MNVIAVFCIALFCNTLSVLSQDFGTAIDFAYYGPTGPQYWGQLWPDDCAGYFQSPIDIQSLDAEDEAFLPIVLNGYGSKDTPQNASMQLVNNGHSVQVNLAGDYHIEGGPLSSIYQAVQLHFHWGSHDDWGSEHRIDGKQYAAEIHVVHYDREKFESFDEAVLVEDGVTVLGILVEVVEKNNPAFDALIQGIKQVTYRGDTYNFPEVFPIAGLLPDEEDQSQYYYYTGSLTTPTCNEVVQWIVFKTPVAISKQQIAVFRTVQEYEVTENNRTLVNNFRPIQPLNGRILYSADAHLIQPSLLFVFIFAISVYFIQQNES